MINQACGNCDTNYSSQGSEQGGAASVGAPCRNSFSRPKALALCSSFLTFVGFVLIIISSFFEFTPISQCSIPNLQRDDSYVTNFNSDSTLPPAEAAIDAQTDATIKSTGIGIPVIIGCVAGCIMLLMRNYFSAFFIAVFSAFFITHEIIIIYDNRAVELGQEMLRSGYLRSVFELYKNALSAKGALLGVVGSAIAAFFAMPAMFFDSWCKNEQASAEAEAKAEAESKSTSKSISKNRDIGRDRDRG